MQVQIAERVLRTFPSLSPVSPVPVFKTKFSAYQHYLKGKHHQGRHSIAEVREAMACFERAADLDPGFAPAYLGMSQLYNLIGVHGWMQPKTAYFQALKSAKRALELDSNNSEVMNALGWAHLAGNRDWAMATRLFERALQLNPNSTSGYCYYSYLLFTRGRADDGVASLEKARGVNPSSIFINSRLTGMYYFARRYDDAIKHARMTLVDFPDDPYTRTYLGLSFLAQRRNAEAVEELQTAVEQSHGDPITVTQLAYAQAQAGRFPLAQALLQKIETTDGQTAVPSYHIALVKLALGRVNEAFDWLDIAYDQCWHWVLLTPHDPRFDILRGTRRFENLCRSMRPVEARRAANSLS
jgi:tetratricopeptide (TPR) repeat protein